MKVKFRDVCFCFVSVQVKGNIIKALCQARDPYNYRFDSGPIKLLDYSS